MRAQFETNFFGLVRMCQLCLPSMRRQGWGRVVNVSSMGGRMTFPGGGAYHATKHAVEAMSDALRYEVRGFGVAVVVIEPGLIKTRFGETAAGSIDTAIEGEDPYVEFNGAVAPRRPGSTRVRWRGSAVGRRPSRRRSSARSRPAGRRRATRSLPPPTWSWPSGAC
jgi:NAD(P)-dependent dehydrogenase (short-subunit alcohol dehydrogenase family)